MKRLLKSHLILFLLPVIAAIALRALFYFSLMASAFKYYSFIRTLDMWTLLKWGIGVFEGQETANNLYILAIANIAYFTEGSLYTINSIYIFQNILGVLTVLSGILGSWYFFKSKSIAVLTGFMIAFYAPLLMYEGFILKTSLITFLTTAMLASISALMERKENIMTLAVLAGIFAGLLLSTYFGALILVLFCIFLIAIKKGERIKKLIVFLIAIFAILTAFTFGTKFNYLPVLSQIKDSEWQAYIYNVGAQREIKDLNSPNGNVSNDNFSFFSYTKKLGMLISSQEVPDNINYCFVRDGIFPLKYLISPFLLYGIALPGLALFLFIGESLKKRLAVVGVIISVILPMIVFVPLSRYTVFLSPVLCAFATWLFMHLFQSICRKNRKNILVAIFFLLAGFYLQENISSDVYRASDFIAYAKALEMQNPQDPRIEFAYKQAKLLLDEDLNK